LRSRKHEAEVLARYDLANLDRARNEGNIVARTIGRHGDEQSA
jgi:hypothetical protein